MLIWPVGRAVDLEMLHHGGTEDTEKYTEEKPTRMDVPLAPERDALQGSFSAFLCVLLRALRASVVRSFPTRNTMPSRVILFSIDGMRPDALAAARTPNIDRLIESGSYAPRASSVMPSV